MNWELIAWFAGIVATLYGLKFVMVFFKTLFNKDTMVNAINCVGSGASKKAKKITKNLKRRIAEKHERDRVRKEQERPVVIIR